MRMNVALYSIHSFVYPVSFIHTRHCSWQFDSDGALVASFAAQFIFFVYKLTAVLKFWPA